MSSTQIEHRTELDQSVIGLTNYLYQKGILEKKDSFIPAEFYKLHETLTNSFFIPKTSITKIMSRLLFSIGRSKKPGVLVGAGTYTGNALAWVSGYYLLDKEQNVKIYGLDISSEVTSIAQKNFKSINADNVSLLATDAIEWINQTEEHIDLLYIDIDTIVDGKKKYIELLNAAYPKMSEGGVILAHDINEEKFLEDMKPFIQEITDRSKYKESINLNVDSFGLSISIKGDTNGDS